MHILPPFEEKIRHLIRDELAKKPTIMIGLRERLEKVYGRGFHHTTSASSSARYGTRSPMRVDTAKIEPRIPELRENYRTMREALLKFVYWTPSDNQEGMPKPLARDRVEAAKSVVMMTRFIKSAESSRSWMVKAGRARSRGRIRGRHRSDQAAAEQTAESRFLFCSRHL